MKKTISFSECDLRRPYMSFFLIFVLLAIFAFLYNIHSMDSFFEKGKGIFLAFFLIGIAGYVLCYFLIPYCYKVEVDEDKIYITKSEAILLSHIENTIVVDKDSLKEVSGSMVGLKMTFWSSRVYYLNFKEETEFGKRVAFLSKMKSPSKLLLRGA